MKFTATLEVTVDDDALQKLVTQAGVALPDSDTELAALMMAMTHTYRSARAFLLTPDHTPMEYGETYQMTSPKDPEFNIMLTLNQGLIPCPAPKATASPKSPSTSQSPKDSTARPPRAASKDSPLPRKRSTKPGTTGPRRVR